MRHNHDDNWAACRMPKLHRAKIDQPMKWPDPAAPNKAWQSVSTGGLLALLGERGTGKTQLACLMMQGVMDHQQRPAVYYRADDLFDHMRSLFSVPAVEAEEARRKLWWTGLLVIDELQDRGDTDFEDRELRRLIDKRYSNCLPTVLIANLTPEAFAKRVGASVISRINEVGQVMVCQWESFRDQAGDAA